jgi:hypothetical protein
VRDLVIVGDPRSSSLIGALSEALRAKAYLRGGIGDVEGREVLLVHPLREPYERSLSDLMSAVESISGRARRIVLAVPHLGVRAGGRVLQYLAGGLDLAGADHLIAVDPAPEVIVAIRTPLVAVSAYPEIARWISRRIPGEGAVVMAPPRLENRAAAFAELLGAELLLMPSDDPRDWGEAGRGARSVLLWDLAASCGELGELVGVRADYYAVPHVDCDDPMPRAMDRVVASDGIDNPYSRVSLAGPIASAALTLRGGGAGQRPLDVPHVGAAARARHRQHLRDDRQGDLAGAPAPEVQPDGRVEPPEVLGAQPPPHELLHRLARPPLASHEPDVRGPPPQGRLDDVHAGFAVGLVGDHDEPRPRQRLVQGVHRGGHYVARSVRFLR